MAFSCFSESSSPSGSKPPPAEHSKSDDRADRSPNNIGKKIPHRSGSSGNEELMGLIQRAENQDHDEHHDDENDAAAWRALPIGEPSGQQESYWQILRRMDQFVPDLHA